MCLKKKSLNVLVALEAKSNNIRVGPPGLLNICINEPQIQPDDHDSQKFHGKLHLHLIFCQLCCLSSSILGFVFTGQGCRPPYCFKSWHRACQTFGSFPSKCNSTGVFRSTMSIGSPLKKASNNTCSSESQDVLVMLIVSSVRVHRQLFQKLPFPILSYLREMGY